MVGGTSTCQLWGGGEGEIEMNRTFVALGQMTKGRLHSCVNDAGFGCQHILSARVDVWNAFENGYEEFNRSIDIANPEHDLVKRGI